MAKKRKKYINPAPGRIDAAKFGSLVEFSDYLNSTPANCLTGGSVDEAGRYDDYYLTENYDQAEKYMIGGWDSGTAKVNKIMSENYNGVETVRRLSLSVVGVMPCVPAYLSGSPRNMINIVRHSVPCPVVRLLFCTGVTSGVDGDDVLKVGAAVFNTILGLEAGGVRVELWCGTVAGASGDMVANFVKIKDTHQTANIMQMCYPVCHPSFQRRHGFAFRERQNLNNTQWEGYGFTVSNIGDIRKCAANCGLDVDAVLTFDSCQYKTELQIAENIQRQMQQ